MRINFCSDDGFVAQHFLNCPKIGAPIYQVGGKGMAEGMWTDVFSYVQFFTDVFNDGENHNPRQLFSSAIQK